MIAKTKKIKEFLVLWSVEVETFLCSCILISKKEVGNSNKYRSDIDIITSILIINIIN